MLLLCRFTTQTHEFSDEDSNDVFDSIYPNTSEARALGSAITAGTEITETVTDTETEPMDVEGTEGSNTPPSQTVTISESSTDAGSSKGKKETLKRGKLPKN